MSKIVDIVIPDIGDFAEVDVIEVLVSTGEEVAQDDSLLTLESDKATMEIPAPFAGKLVSLSVEVGDKVQEGSIVGQMEIAAVEVLLTSREREYRDAFLKTERSYRTYTAYYAEKDLARITTDFLPPAVQQQIELENGVNDVLRTLGKRALVTSSLLTMPKAHAEKT